MERQVAPPPFTNARRAQSAADDPPNYAARTNKLLKAEMKRRRLPLQGLTRKSQFVDALQQSDHEDLVPQQAWVRRMAGTEEAIATMEDQTVREDSEILISCGDDTDLDPDDSIGLPRYRKPEYYQAFMFVSKYKTDPTRNTLLDLPGEIRNIIYELVLIDLWAPWWLAITDKGKLYAGRRHSNDGSDCVKSTIATLQLLGAVSKQIRSEARSLFWAKLQFELHYINCGNQHRGLQHFLTTIGPEGRASIPHLHPIKRYDSDSPYPRPRPASYQSLRSLLRTLPLCLSLKTFKLEIDVSDFFGGDIEALKTFFFHTVEPLNLISKNLETLITTLSAMPRIEDVVLTIKQCSISKYCNNNRRTEEFLEFAFSGMREIKLCEVIKKRLEGDGETRKLERGVSLVIDLPSTGTYMDEIMMDYRDWFRCRRNKMQEPRRLPEEKEKALTLWMEDVIEEDFE